MSSSWRDIGCTEDKHIFLRQIVNPQLKKLGLPMFQGWQLDSHASFKFQISPQLRFYSRFLREWAEGNDPSGEFYATLNTNEGGLARQVLGQTEVSLQTHISTDAARASGASEIGLGWIRLTGIEKIIFAQNPCKNLTLLWYFIFFVMREL